MRMSADLSTDCKSIDAELDRGFAVEAAKGQGRKLSDRAQEHIRNCARCRQLYEWLTQERPLQNVRMSGSSAAVYDRIQKQLKNSLVPVSPQASPRVLAAQFFVVFLLFASPAIAMMGTAGLREMTVVQLVGIGSLLLLGALLLAWSLAWQMTPGSRHRIPARAAVLTLAAGFLAGIAILFPWRSPEAFLARGWPCLRAGVLMAIPAALVFWVLVRRGYFFPIGVLGGTLGAIAGLLSVSVLQFTCDRQDVAHLLVWHGGVLVVCTILGIAVARIVDRVSRNAV